MAADDKVFENVQYVNNHNMKNIVDVHFFLFFISLFFLFFSLSLSLSQSERKKGRKHSKREDTLEHTHTHITYTLLFLPCAHHERHIEEA